MTTMRKEWVANLAKTLEPVYQPSRVIGGHSWIHVSSVVSLGSKIQQYLPIDPDVYAATALLHNLDRVGEYGEAIRRAGGEGAWVLDHWLVDSPFTPEEREWIADAVVNHTKKDLGPNPSAYLLALTDADKADRLTPLNVMDGAAHWKDHPFFDFASPFDYRKAKESLLRRFMWNFEWVGMMSCDEARQLLINPAYFRAFITYVRELGQQIADILTRMTGETVDNRIEKEIQTALGSYYEWAMTFTGLGDQGPNQA